MRRLFHPAICLISLAPAIGCAELKSQLVFRNVSLVDTPIETVAGELPTAADRTTEGFAYLELMRWPESETALVVLHGPDMNVSAKLLVHRQTQRLGSARQSDVILKAELRGDPSTGRRPGPAERMLETLRRLSKRQGKPTADRAHALAAAALMRAIESFADVTPPQSLYQKHGDTLEQIPANGVVTITNASPQSYGLSYRASERAL